MNIWILCGNLSVEDISSINMNMSDNKSCFLAWNWKQNKQNKKPKIKPIKQIYFILSWVTDAIYLCDKL